MLQVEVENICCIPLKLVQSNALSHDRSFLLFWLQCYGCESVQLPQFLGSCYWIQKIAQESREFFVRTIKVSWDGVFIPISKDEIACLEISSTVASSAMVKPLASRASVSLNQTSLPPIVLFPELLLPASPHGQILSPVIHPAHKLRLR